MKGWRATLAVVMPALVAGGMTWHFSKGQEPAGLSQQEKNKVGEILGLIAELEAQLVPYLKKDNGEPNIRADFAMVAISEVRLAVTRYEGSPTQDNLTRLNTALTHMSTEIDRAKAER